MGYRCSARGLFDDLNYFKQCDCTEALVLEPPSGGSRARDLRDIERTGSQARNDAVLEFNLYRV